MPDLAVTSSTGLALIPECRCRIDAADYRPKMPIPDSLFLDIPTFTYDLSITSDMSTSQRNTTTSRLWTCICVILFTTSSIDVQGVHLSPSYSSFSQCRTFRHPVSPEPEWKIMQILEPVRYSHKVALSVTGMIRYRIERSMSVSGMPMPAALAWMPMPSYAITIQRSA